MEMLEVFEATIQLGSRILSIFLKTWPFTSASSKTASITIWRSEKSCRLVVGMMFARVTVLSSSVQNFLEIPVSSTADNFFKASSKRSWAVSFNITDFPAIANTRAISAPIIPAPITPNFAICISVLLVNNATNIN